MLQLKVRAWHRKNQRMMTPEEVSQEGYTLDPSGRGFAKFANDGTGKFQYASTMIPLIASGQKDKKGVEIFEADIVRYDSRVYQVLWHETGLWMIGDTGKPVDIVMACDEAEVIGDLYSHPERINE